MTKAQQQFLRVVFLAGLASLATGMDTAAQEKTNAIEEVDGTGEIHHHQVIRSRKGNAFVLGEKKSGGLEEVVDFLKSSPKALAAVREMMMQHTALGKNQTVIDEIINASSMCMARSGCAKELGACLADDECLADLGTKIQIWGEQVYFMAEKLIGTTCGEDDNDCIAAGVRAYAVVLLRMMAPEKTASTARHNLFACVDPCEPPDGCVDPSQSSSSFKPVFQCFVTYMAGPRDDGIAGHHAKCDACIIKCDAEADPEPCRKKCDETVCADAA